MAATSATASSAAPRRRSSSAWLQRYAVAVGDQVGAEVTRRSNPPTVKTKVEATQLNNKPPAAQVEADVASSPMTDKHHNLLAVETEALTNACK